MPAKKINIEEESEALKAIRRQKKKSPRMKVSGGSVRELARIIKNKSVKK
ncbi:MAG: hypothetical protein WC693_03470 [Patescibacteria group bacterium]|jgi:hypothetical protein